MNKLKKFIKASLDNLFLTPDGGLSLTKLAALATSVAATYKFIIMDSNDPWIWLVYLGVVGGHGVAAEILKRFGGKNVDETPV